MHLTSSHIALSALFLLSSSIQGLALPSADSMLQARSAYDPSVFQTTTLAEAIAGAKAQNSPFFRCFFWIFDSPYPSSQPTPASTPDKSAYQRSFKVNCYADKGIDWPAAADGVARDLVIMAVLDPADGEWKTNTAYRRRARIDLDREISLPADEALAIVRNPFKLDRVIRDTPVKALEGESNLEITSRWAAAAKRSLQAQGLWVQQYQKLD
ncbi:MAG: hypothetical protein M1829_000330 [Trizodia sp. TS-e1964]|nr:MAG: hypothetical protein M1829_000330 [Trizodia sp. TS-e1964]